MGLFKKTGEAKASFGQDYSKPGQYFLLVEAAKFGKHSQKGVEQAIFEGRILHVVEKALWNGDPKQVPKSKGGQNLLNLPGAEPKVGEPCNFVFQDGILGNENRLRKFIITLDDCSDDDYPRDEASIAAIFDPVLQPYKNTVIEIKAGEVKTKKADASGNSSIVGSTPLRRVYATEIQQLWEAKRLEQNTMDILSKEDRLVKMLAMDAEEKKAKETKAVATK